MTDIIPHIPDNAPASLVTLINSINEHQKLHDDYVKSFEAVQDTLFAQLRIIIDGEHPLYPTQGQINGIERLKAMFESGEKIRDIHILSGDSKASFYFDAKKNHAMLTTHRGIMGPSASPETFTEKTTKRIAERLEESGFTIVDEWAFNGGRTFVIIHTQD